MPNRETEPQDLEQERQEIARLAYSYWESRGCIDGHDVEDWLMAEEEVRSRRALRQESRREDQRRTAA
jgi:hypothetical protein